MSDYSILFAVTAAFSIYGVSYYRKNGSLPEYSVQDAEHLPIEEQNFSAVPGDKLNGHENMQLNRPDEEDAHFPHTNGAEINRPSGPNTWDLQQPHTAPTDSGFEPVELNASYYGVRHPYDSSQQSQSQPTFQDSATNSPYHTPRSNERQRLGALEPLPAQMQGGVYQRNLALDYDHGGYASGGRVDFPQGDYDR